MKHKKEWNKLVDIVVDKKDFIVIGEYKLQNKLIPITFNIEDLDFLIKNQTEIFESELATYFGFDIK